jgi:hypothetical protein
MISSIHQQITNRALGSRFLFLFGKKTQFYITEFFATPVGQGFRIKYGVEIAVPAAKLQF